MNITSEITNKFAGVTALILGDVMLDQYWWGIVSRISPEAPVPVVKLNEMTLAPGGAANVAANVAGLGATPVLLGCVGRDPESSLLTDHLRTLGIATENLRPVDRPTSTKTRIVAHSQHVVRVDRENNAPIADQDETSVSESFVKLVKGVDIVIISDYAKGLLTPSLVQSAISAARSENIPILVDPKGKDYSKYRGATVITPNKKEAADACGLDENDPDIINVSGNRLMDDLGFDFAIITEGERGMTLFTRGSRPLRLKAETREVYDVTGAGDTVIATLGVAMAAGMPMFEAVQLSNLAASLVVEHVGTTAISLELLIDKIISNAMDTDVSSAPA